MLREIRNLNRLFRKTQKFSVAGFILLQFILAILFRTVFHSYLKLEGIDLSWNPSNFMMLFLLLFGFGLLSFTILTVYLGFVFHPYLQQAWIRRLPISEALLFAYPTSLLFLYGVFLYGVGLTYWHQYAREVGASFALFGFLVPFTIFWFMRSLRNPWIGFFVGISVVGAIIFTHMQWLWFWHYFQWRLIGELFYIGVLAIIILAVERQNKLYPMAFIGTVVLFFCAPLSFPILRSPDSLGSAVSDVMYYPSSAALHNYKKYISDDRHWTMPVVQYPSQRAFYILNQLLVEKFLSPEEKTELLKLVMAKHDVFEWRRDAADLLPTSWYPISSTSITKEGEAFLLSSWRDEYAYCYFLPVTSSDFFEKIFRSQCGVTRLFDDGIWTRYQPAGAGDFDRTLEHYLLQAHAIASNPVKRRLMGRFLREADWNQDNSVILGDTFLFKSSIDLALLDKWKSDYHRNDRKRIQQFVAMDRTTFERTIRKVNENRIDARDREVLEIFCRLVSDRCEVHREDYFGESLPRLLQILRLKPNFDPHLAWYKDQLLKPELWARIQSLKNQDL
jgi:hypothetical protein